MTATRRKPVPRHPTGGGFSAIRTPEQLVPCAADPEPFEAAQAEIENNDWLGHVPAIRAICDYCLPCPVADQCAAAAPAERWTGIAGGHIWKDGERRT